LRAAVVLPESLALSVSSAKTIAKYLKYLRNVMEPDGKRNRLPV